VSPLFVAIDTDRWEDRHMIEALGFAAGTLTTLAFMPQVLKSWKRRSVDDLSLGMLVAFNLGIILWIAYGVAIAALPIIATNVVTLTLTATLLALKVGHRPA
jgi:MtN3 and saliva related transmembrane protein